MKQALTAKFVESLKAGPSKQIIIDAATPNLRLIVRPSGSKVWAWQGKCKGKPLTMTLGRYPSHGLADARTWAMDLNERRDGGEDLFVSKKADNDAEPVVEVAIDPDAYRTCDWLFDLHMKNEAANYTTGDAKQSMYDRYVKPVVGSKHVNDVEYDDFMSILRTVLTVGGPSASNHCQSMIHRWWRWAMINRDLTKLKANPVSDLPKLATEKPRTRALNRYEIGVFFRVMEGTKTVLNEALDLILYAGSRRLEAVQVPWEEIDLETGDWLLPQERNKSGRDHLLCLPPTVIERLKERKKIGGNARWVWTAERCSADEPKPINTFTKVMKRIVAACQKIAEDEGKTFKPFTIHDLRRTVSSGMSGLRDENDKSKIAPHIVERVLNHKMDKLAGTYNVHDYYAEKKAALKLWADHLDEIRSAALAATQ